MLADSRNVVADMAAAVADTAAVVDTAAVADMAVDTAVAGAVVVATTRGPETGERRRVGGRFEQDWRQRIFYPCAVCPGTEGGEGRSWSVRVRSLLLLLLCTCLRAVLLSCWLLVCSFPLLAVCSFVGCWVI